MKQTHKLTIYLIKDIYTSFESCLRQDSEVVIRSYNLKPELNVDGMIYVAETKEQSSKWHSLLQQGTNEPIPSLSNASNRAALFLRVNNRIFCCCFGYGQYILHPGRIERNFGLKASLNSINQNRLKSMDKAKLEELTVQTRIQSSQTTNRGSFNIDILGDLLKSITGETIDKDFGNNITGTDAVYINPKVEFSDLKPLVEKLSLNYNTERYKENFDWIDNLENEKDPDLINELDEALLDSIKQKDLLTTSISLPFIIDWTNYSGVSFTPKGELTDLEIENFYAYKDSKLSSLTLDKLKGSAIYLENSESENRTPISLMKCLNFQAEINNVLYVRSLGKWYKVHKDFAQQILEDVNALPESTVPFIDCEYKWDEQQYNTELANSNPDFTLFDRKLIQCKDVRSKIEACDILTKERELIHIKPKNESSTLSHLFAQGRIGAIALTSDKAFRVAMRTIIRRNNDFDPDVIPLEKVNNTEFTITYATITKGDTGIIEKLPFFSLLNLRQSAQFLHQHGFNVKVKKIKKKEET